jgi:hypothetical protein
MDRAEQVRQILAAKGLTLYRVSQRSAEIYRRSSRFHVPHSLYHDVADPALLPNIHQMLALSHITNYRVYDWLAAFGFDLDRISNLQFLIPRQRTTLLDSSVYDVHAWIPRFADRPNQGPLPPIAPLGQFLVPATPRRAAELLGLRKRRFLYCKVGEGDVYAFPRLAPGSIVRVDERRHEELFSGKKNNAEGRIFLVEHGFGLTCSELVVLEKNRIVLHSRNRPCEQLELGLGREARILGVVDAEIRPMAQLCPSLLAHRSASSPKLQVLHAQSPQSNLKDFLRNSGLRAGLSFREASSMSRWVANTLSDQLYFAAPSTLSDYETLSGPPRHIQKIIALCIVYGIGFEEFLRAFGLPLDQDGRDPMPDELVPRQAPSRSHGLNVPSGQEILPEGGGFLDSLLKQWEEVPVFLRSLLNELTGFKSLSTSDVFWVGGDETPIHALLLNATFVVVNRRAKNPAQAKAVSESPLWLLLKRDGTYLCGCCALHQGESSSSAPILADGLPYNNSGTGLTRRSSAG